MVNFLGYSAITDGYGEVLKQYHNEEGILIHKIILDKSLKKNKINIENHSGFSTKVTWHYKWRSLVESKGKKSSKKRK